MKDKSKVKDHRITVRLTPRQNQWLIELSEDKNIDRAKIIRTLLDLYMEKLEP